MSDANSKIDRAREKISPGWWPFLENEFDKEYMESIRKFLKNETQQKKRYFPSKENIFRSLKNVDYEQVRVVIIGQDPYHGMDQATGLCFAVPDSIPNPPSLQNIFQEVENDIGQKPRSSELVSWAKQGVLLLNTVLTVRENEPLSHRNIGWEIFTDKVIESLNHRTNPVVFLLWGKQSQEKEKMLTNKIHKILKAPHPSPLSAYRGFMGCKHFSKTNAILKSLGQKEIHWAD
jgi:uracil-DNA glycosylase